MNIITAIGLFIIIFILTEVLRGIFHIGSETTRKIAHVLSGVVALTLPFLISREEALFVAGVFLLFLILSTRTSLLRSVHTVQRRTYGAYLYPITLALLAWMTWKSNVPAYTYAVLTLSLADAGAGILGRGRLDLQSVFPSQSNRGTLVFFFITILIGFGVLFAFSLATPWYWIFASALILALVERYSPFGTDNLTVPIIAVWLFIFFW